MSGWTLAFLQELSPREFESVVCALWKAMGYEIKRPPTLGPDEGIDICAVSQTVPILQIGIQCKKHTKNESVTARDIREYASVRQRLGLDAIVVVTSSQFTKTALEEAKHLNVKTIDGNELVLLLNKYHVPLPKIADHKQPTPLPDSLSPQFRLSEQAKLILQAFEDSNEMLKQQLYALKQEELLSQKGSQFANFEQWYTYQVKHCDKFYQIFTAITNNVNSYLRPEFSSENLVKITIMNIKNLFSSLIKLIKHYETATPLSIVVNQADLDPYSNQLLQALQRSILELIGQVRLLHLTALEEFSVLCEEVIQKIKGLNRQNLLYNGKDTAVLEITISLGKTVGVYKTLLAKLNNLQNGYTDLIQAINRASFDIDQFRIPPEEKVGVKFDLKEGDQLECDFEVVSGFDINFDLFGPNVRRTEKGVHSLRLSIVASRPGDYSFVFDNTKGFLERTVRVVWRGSWRARASRQIAKGRSFL